MERVQYALSIATNQAFLPEPQAVSKLDPLAFIQLRDGVNYRLPDSQSLEKPFDTASLRRGTVKINFLSNYSETKHGLLTV
jgi:hypothetical protein